MRARIAVLALLGLLVSAQAQFGTGPLDVVRWSPFKSGTISNAKAPFARAIVSEADFQTYWARFHGDAPQNAPRGIDWLKEQLVAIHLGERSTGGYEVRVTSMTRSHAAEITVEYSEITPAKGAMTTQAITSPWVVVRMDRAAGSLTFRKSVRQATSGIATTTCGCCAQCTCIAGPPVEILRPLSIEFPNPYGNAFDRRVWWQDFDSGENCEIPGFGFTIIRNVAEMGQYWMRLTGQNKTPWDRPAVNWGREQLLAINVGKTQGSGYRVYVDSVERTRSNEITVRYTVVIPPPSAVVPRVSSPYTIIRLERNADQVVLVRNNVQPYAGYAACTCRCGRCRGH